MDIPAVSPRIHFETAGSPPAANQISAAQRRTPGLRMSASKQTVRLEIRDRPYSYGDFRSHSGSRQADLRILGASRRLCENPETISVRFPSKANAVTQPGVRPSQKT